MPFSILGDGLRFPKSASLAIIGVVAGSRIDMPKPVYRSIREPLRHLPSFDERWNGPDGGLITCWESGRELASRKPEIAGKAKMGELPALGWKGGVEKKLKVDKKFGSFRYLAQWQGLRGEDLDIDVSVEKTIVCAKTGMSVIFTSDSSKLSAP